VRSCSYRTVLTSLGFLFLFLLAGCENNDGPEANATIERPEKVVPVSYEIVKASDLLETFTLPAGLEAWEDLVISAEIAGPVNRINFEEGQRVKKGEVMLEIDAERVKSNLARDEENYAVNKRKLERYRELSAEGLVSDQELDELDNLVTAADMTLKATRIQLDKCYPKAPISGIVDLHYVDRGEYVDSGKPLLRLVQIDKLKAIADIPEKDVLYLKVGQAVDIITATINDREPSSLKGTIEHIAYSANEMTRTYRAKIVIDNSAGTLRPGMIVRARFVRQQLQQVISVPLYAVLDREGKKSVFVVENGVAKQLNVEIGSSVDQRVVIKSGLQAGQRLIVKGQQLLIDGAKIAPEEL